MIDLLIKGGTLVDGSGRARFQADLAIVGDRIADIGSFETDTAQVTLDAQGLIVAPGFIDMHSHADFSLPVAPLAHSLVHQGITSVVVGQCGLSPAPLFSDTRADIEARWSLVEDPMPWQEWSGFGDYLGFLEKQGVSLNVTSLVAHGTLRAGVMGFSDEVASDSQMSAMQDAAEQAMQEGAIGLSSGLIYPPGSYASTAELVELMRPVARRQGFYFSHIRGEGETLLPAISEALEIGRQSGASVQICHFKAAGNRNWDKAQRALDLIEHAQQDGVEVTMDMYPYLAGSTFLTALLPERALDGGKEATLERLRSPSSRSDMEVEMKQQGFCYDADLAQVLISSAPGKLDYEGGSIVDLANAEGKSPYTWIFDALLTTELDIMIVPFMMSEHNLRLGLRQPEMMIGTDGWGLAVDGPLNGGKPHPRSYGTYPRILGRYVREEGVLSLEEAVSKMTGQPAAKLRWSDRGLLRKGQAADIVIFDADRVVDKATFEEPHQYPEGIPHVIVSGVPVVQDGRHTQARPGQIVAGA